MSRLALASQHHRSCGRIRGIATALVFAIAALVAAGAPTRAAEVIRSFGADIQIAANGELIVKETISVSAEGRKIRRGIYRDFPLIVETRDGKEREVGFDLVSVKRDGRNEPYHTERGSRSIRIYIGDKDIFLSPGKYTYEITYKTDRQIRYFEDHDELFWNATGNFWDFPIETATAVVHLPEPGRITDTVAYTGKYGSPEQNARANIIENGTIARFTTTNRLAPREGLTVGVSFPKGVVALPSELQRSKWWLRDHRGEIIALGLLTVISLFYFINWWRVGRDPPQGVIVPRWDPPDGISPALVNYIDRKGLAGKGWTAISAAILDLAVKGLVEITDLDSKVSLKLTGKTPDSNLPVGERAIYRILENRGGELRIAESNGSAVKRLQNKFSSAIESEHRGKFYRRNMGITILGIALSVIGLILLFVFGGLNEDAIGIIIAVGVGGTVLVSMASRLVLGFTVRQALGSRIMAVIFAGIFSFVFMSAVIPIAIQSFASVDRPLVMTAIIGIAILNVLFFFLLGAPTAIGRKMMNGIEGLKTYINLAEKDRLNLAGAPQMSPEHFEKVLPYAVALRLEKPWTKAFETWLASAIAAGAVAATWHPGWYHGRSFRPDSIGRSMRDISGSIESSLTEAMPAPKSSSSGFSGGGDFSGGGGGGGGGGGW